MPGARLSVVAIVKNEERNLEEFLRTHEFADEIVLVDGGSTDGTRTIAERHPKVRFLTREWTGFPAQWNHAIDHATGDWVLVSEADQRVSDSLRADVAEVLTGRRNGDAFLIPRRNYIFGRWLRHGGCWPDYCYPRLFRRGIGRFDEAKPIHEKLIATGTIGRLAGHFDHYSIHTMDQYLAKMTHYTTVEARAFVDLIRAHGSRLGAARAIFRNRALSFRHRLSYLRSLVPGWPVLSFFWRYVMRLGFLDGRAGFRFCMLSSFYEFVWRAKAAELMKHE